MASLSEIQNRMNSIRDTMKITKAMYMISSNKLRKAKKDLEANEPYRITLENEITRILRHTPEFSHIYFDNREKDMMEEVKKCGFIVVTADKGMAGAYNHNVIKCAEKLMAKEKDYKLYVIGEMGRQYFASAGYHIAESFHYTAQNPTLYRAKIIAEYMIEQYIAEELDEIYIIYTSMVNGISDEVTVEKLLPLLQSIFAPKLPPEIAMLSYQEEFKLIPSAESLIESLVPNYLTGLIYSYLIESFCCEQNERMMAMDAANRNAEEMLKDLSITYNRVRQGAITQEITEVVGGASALKRNARKRKNKAKAE